MLASDRLLQVLKLVKSEGTLRSSEIARRLEVSTMTVRRDLDELEQQGLVRRVHGGARVVDERDVDYALRADRNRLAKQLIGAKAAGFVQDGETIYLDSGTTSMEVARALQKRRLERVRVVTHAVNIASEISGTPQLQLLQIGGEIFLHNFSATGPLALETIRRFSFDRIFLATQGIDPLSGLTNSSLLEAEVKAAALAASRWVCLISDSSKWGRVTFARFAGLEQIDVWVTDSRLSDEGRKTAMESGVEVITVSNGENKRKKDPLA